jgi:hypothetical protein
VEGGGGGGGGSAEEIKVVKLEVIFLHKRGYGGTVDRGR